MKKKLTRREQEVVSELCKNGATNDEIAAVLFVEVGTVKFHMNHACEKAGVTNRTALALWWIRQGHYLHSSETNAVEVEEVEEVKSAVKHTNPLYTY